MNKTLINLWRAELRKEAVIWWDKLSQVQKNNLACGRTEDKIIDDLIAPKLAAVISKVSIMK